MDLLTWIIVGLVAGVLASLVMGGTGYGIIGDIIIGIVGAFVGGLLGGFAGLLGERGFRGVGCLLGIGLLAALVLALFLSVAVGARPISPSTVWTALSAADPGA